MLLFYCEGGNLEDLEKTLRADKNKKQSLSLITEIMCSGPNRNVNCAVPENIHTHHKDGQWKFRRVGRSQKPKFLKESMKLNWKFQGGGMVQTKEPSLGEVWIFFGTTIKTN